MRTGWTGLWCGIENFKTFFNALADEGYVIFVQLYVGFCAHKGGPRRGGCRRVTFVGTQGSGGGET